MSESLKQAIEMTAVVVRFLDYFISIFHGKWNILWFPNSCYPFIKFSVFTPNGTAKF